MYNINTTNIDHGICIEFQNMLDNDNIKYCAKLLRDKGGMPRTIEHEGYITFEIEMISFDEYNENIIEFKLKYL